MNYSCEYQDELQSAFWSQASVTFFTAAIMHDETCQMFLVWSDTKVKPKDIAAVSNDHLNKNYIIRTPCFLIL